MRWTGKVKSGWFGLLYAEASVAAPTAPFYFGAPASKLVWVRVNLPVLKQIIEENQLLRSNLDAQNEARVRAKKDR